MLPVGVRERNLEKLFAAKHAIQGDFHGNISSASMSLAVQRVLAQLYSGMIEAETPVSDMIPEKEWRNQEIVWRYMNGERAVDLAREFGISRA